MATVTSSNVVARVEDSRSGWKGFALEVHVDPVVPNTYEVFIEGPRGGMYPDGGLKVSYDDLKQLIRDLVTIL